MYFSIFLHKKCPALLSHTHARRTFDRALRTLPPSLHSRIWVRYLLWAERRGGETMSAVYRRYMAIDPSITERYAALLLNPLRGEHRPLESAKLLLTLARKAQRGEYVSPEGKSPYQLLEDFINVVENYSEEVGMDIQDTDNSNAAAAEADAAADAAAADKEKTDPVSVDGKLVRLAGPAIPVDAEGKPTPPYDEDEDPLSSRKLNIELIIYKDGLNVYKDQAGRLWAGLATYWIKRAEFDRAVQTFEKGMKNVFTIRDFNQIFEAYTEFGEGLMSALMQRLEEDDEMTEEEVIETQEELDQRMKDFEDLADRRPFLVNDVLIRRNPNDVQEWVKRVALWGDNDEKVISILLSFRLKIFTCQIDSANVHTSTGNRQSSQGVTSPASTLHQLRSLLRRRGRIW